MEAAKKGFSGTDDIKNFFNNPDYKLTPAQEKLHAEKIKKLTAKSPLHQFGLHKSAMAKVVIEEPTLGVECKIK